MSLSAAASVTHSWDSHRRTSTWQFSDGYYPIPDPTVNYLALTRVKHDPAGQLEPGRVVKVKAFECEELGFRDTERLYVKPRPGEHFPSRLKLLI